eukprot:CAMPEP_0178410686 /NCGR_PEP_ID=MMETSP0689_2-20121128/21110_1 /TAXON_ID=160604 /ORGANISM="Amphidinium massartii, Strain CS-259" /LENGTH=306 /DNA_ID=CAMNT_0020031875 /DNA_START=84 /DNA_END=1001 /DNA_ORIENTATION=-
MLRLLVFDFDCTLSVLHVYRTLAGELPGSPPPFAKTERGQLARLVELEKQAFVWHAFGGQGRVATISAFIAELRNTGVECVVATRGYVGVARFCLDRVGLLGHFSKIYGAVGESSGKTDFDLALPRSALGSEASYLGSPDQAAWSTKGNLFAKLLTERGVPPTASAFIDDDPAEVAEVRGVCPNVVQVTQRRGLGDAEMQQIASFARSGAGGGKVGGRSFSLPPRGAGMPMGGAGSFRIQQPQPGGLGWAPVAPVAYVPPFHPKGSNQSLESWEVADHRKVMDRDYPDPSRTMGPGSRSRNSVQIE